MVSGMQGLQSQKIGSWACSGCGTFVIPDDSGVIVVSCSEGELGYAMMSSNHIVMGYCSHKLKVTISDGPFGIGDKFTVMFDCLDDGDKFTINRPIVLMA